ncbi:MAG: signal recognition particle protein [Pseudomonadota bacterium]
MFDQLQERLSKVFRNLAGLGKIREGNISEALSEVRTALLEADVAYRVVQSLVDSVRREALGQEVLSSVKPGELFVKILYDHLVETLGGDAPELPKGSGRPVRILLTGLQGSGKTTTAAKLARLWRDERKERPLLVPADTARPAAREQLEQLGHENGIQVFSSRDPNAVDVCKAAIRAVEGQEIAANALIFDSAGRLGVDESLMAELAAIREAVKPDLVLYVLDAMAGQDALRSAEAFHEKIGFDGVIVSKMDGDARGGAALSVRYTIGKPIYFLGVGEKIDALERLHPERLASRILGMGDVVSLVERARKAVDIEEAARLAKKLRKGAFTVEDFAEQLRAVKKMGSFEDIVGMLPGGAQVKKALAGGIPQQELDRAQVIVNSMTRRERHNDRILDGSRRKRIAAGSGTTVADVNRFLKQFSQAREMISRLGRMGARGLPRGGLF